MAVTRIRTYEDLMALPTGERFTVALPKSLPWKDLHGLFYRTANREVTLALRDGSTVTGTLAETPGFFALSTKAGPRVWLRVPGRKTRKGIDPREVKRLTGYKAPSLAEALDAFVILHSSNPSKEQVATALDTASKM